MERITITIKIKSLFILLMTHTNPFYTKPIMVLYNHDFFFIGNSCMHSALSSTTHKCCFSEKEHILHSEFRGQFNLTKNIEEHKKKRNGEGEKPTGGICVGFFWGGGGSFFKWGMF